MRNMISTAVVLAGVLLAAGALAQQAVPVVGWENAGGKGKNATAALRDDAVLDADTNDDGVIDEDEAEAAIKRADERMRELFQKRNQMVLKRFDGNKNGHLDGAELDKYHEAKLEWHGKIKDMRDGLRKGRGAGVGVRKAERSVQPGPPAAGGAN